ncbi:I17RC protein, partial [Hemiprocne comata]|nr:I17RC protein [Hemiprocne comata]
HPSPGAATDTKAWEQLWARSRLVLHTGGSALTCSLLAPCDLPVELVPCWQPAPTRPCQALPGLQQPAMGQVGGALWGARALGGMQVALTEHPFCPQGPQEFGGLQPHPNLCMQVWSSGQVRLTQCLRDREYCGVGGQRQPGGVQLRGEPPWPPLTTCPAPATSPGVLPGHPDDLLVLEHAGNSSMCALERDACTPLASFTSTVRGRDPCVPLAVALAAQAGGTGGTARSPLLPSQGAGHPGLLELELRRDVAAGQCRQIWHPENSTSITLWACPLHKYLRTHWALAWMGVLLGAVCLLLLLLLKKEDIKGKCCLCEGCDQPET